MGHAAGRTVHGLGDKGLKTVGLLPTPLGVEVLHGWQLRPGDVLSRLHHLQQSLTIQGGAAASQDTLSTKFTHRFQPHGGDIRDHQIP